MEADSNLRQKLKTLLHSQGDEVFIAEDIAKAYTMSCFRGYSFILFNQGMDHEAGGNLCEQIRAVNKATPLFFYTDEELEPNKGHEAKIQDYEAQSITTNAMLKTIFLRISKDRTKPSSAVEALNHEVREGFLE